ncbi:nicotinate-nicotinamide nucleotide adenylyltransferase [bacterium]|nr:nicotinate-nicotinamide nucleotide adenylyltransferase [bacterium]
MTPAAPRVGIFGGSFNPPHMAHILVVAWALGTGEIDEVWAIPTGGHPFGKKLAPFEDRMEMTRRALACFGDRVKVLDIEREPRVHYSIETMRELARQYPGNSWRWIMGSDTLLDAERWLEYEKLMEMAPPLVVPRSGKGTVDVAGGFSLPDLSSTFVREEIAGGREGELAGLVPGGVLDWIRQKSLYRAGE